METLHAWESFYVIIGSSAAALTGLQFVVIVLGAESGMPSPDKVTRAFGTPTIVHFCAVLLTSAILSAPWRGVSTAAMSIAAMGLAGIAYTLLVLRHARRQTVYKPVLEDWIWHTVLPLLAYAGLFTCGTLLPRDADPLLFVIAACALLLLFVGIHNAWDSVTYIASTRRTRKEGAPPDDAPSPPTGARTRRRRTPASATGSTRPPVAPTPPADEQPEPPPTPGQASDAQRRKLFALMRDKGMPSGRLERLAWASEQLERVVESSTDLTFAEAARLIEILEQPAEASEEPKQEPLGYNELPPGY